MSRMMTASTIPIQVADIGSAKKALEVKGVPFTESGEFYVVSWMPPAAQNHKGPISEVEQFEEFTDIKKARKFVRELFDKNQVWGVTVEVRIVQRIQDIDGTLMEASIREFDASRNSASEWRESYYNSGMNQQSATRIWK